jgi:uncharacterized repeat protein (TIGR01451 family)
MRNLNRQKLLRTGLTMATLMVGLPLGGLAAEVAPPTLGQNIVVTGSPADAIGSCTGDSPVVCTTLRAAVIYANTNGNLTQYDRIVLDNGSVHTLTLTGAGEDAAATGDLDILSHLAIETADPLNYASKATIQGGTDFLDRLMHIAPAGSSVIVKLSNLVLTKGQGKFMNGGGIYATDLSNLTITRSVITDNYASWDGNYGDPAVDGDGTNELQGSGGGIYSKGPLNISFSVLSKNSASTYVGLAPYEKNGNGGAIYASQATTISDTTIGGEGAGNLAINGAGIQMGGGNKLEIVRSTFSYNDAVSGGGINVVSPAVTFTITNSTFSANHVSDSGAGISTNTSVTILNTTIANNSKDSGNKGTGINQVGGTVTLKNTLLANNVGGGSSANCGMVGGGTVSILSFGGNLSTDASCNLTSQSDQQNVADPKIGPLALNDNALNGTFTHALLEGSPAIDKGITDGCPGEDQRGFVRPFDALVVGTKVCDIGAYELSIDRRDLAIVSMVADATRVEVNTDVTVTISVSNTSSVTATGVVLTATLPAGATLTSGTFNGGTCSATGTTVTCKLPDLASATAFPVQLKIKLASAGENIVSAAVSSAATDPFPSNNTASVTLIVLTRADMNLTAANVSVQTGVEGTVSMVLLNQGTGDAKKVVLTGSVPSGLTLVSISDTALCAINGAAFSCTIPEILASASRTIDIKVSSAMAATYSVAASVTGDYIDPDAADNAVTVTVTVTAPPVVQPPVEPPVQPPVQPPVEPPSSAVPPAGGDDGGCTVNPSGRFDPLLPLLLALGMGGLLVSRRRGIKHG